MTVRVIDGPCPCCGNTDPTTIVQPDPVGKPTYWICEICGNDESEQGSVFPSHQE